MTLSLGAALLLSCSQDSAQPYEPYCEPLEVLSSGEQPTWSGEVAEIVEAHCVRCHREGGSGGQPFETWEQTAGWAPAMAAMVSSGAMPPFSAAQCADCPELADAPEISEEERAVLVAWAESGALEGSSRESLVAPEPAGIEAAPQDRLDEYVTRGLYTPSGSSQHPYDDYRCFVLQAEAGQGGGYMTGWDFVYGDAVLTGEDLDGDGQDDGISARDQMVHHALLYLLPDDQRMEEAKALAAASPEQDGYPCFGGPQVRSEMIAGWVPGMGSVVLPEGTGIAIPERSHFVLQLHYYLAEGSHPDQTRAQLAMRDGVEQPAELVELMQRDLDLPPGEPSLLRSARLELAEDRVLWGVIPHMHQLGASFQLVRQDQDGLESCVLDLPVWDFSWQRFYLLEEGLTARAGDQLEARYYFDTRSRAESTDWGEGSEDEMAISYLLVSGGSP